MNENGLWLPGSSTKEAKIEKWWEVNRKHDPPLSRGATPLVERCMRVYGWREAFTMRTLRGYRQFMELKSVMNDWQETKLSAPLAVQQMWEQHILDNLNYTDDCFLLFGRVIGHDPDASLDDRRVGDRVKTTKIAFQARYGGDMDPEVWDFGHPEIDAIAVDGPEAGNEPPPVTPRGMLPVAGVDRQAAPLSPRTRPLVMAATEDERAPSIERGNSMQDNPRHRGITDRGMADRGMADRGMVAERGIAERGMADRGMTDMSSTLNDRSLVNRDSLTDRTSINDRSTINERSAMAESRGRGARAHSPPNTRTRSLSKGPRSPKSPTGNDPITIFLRDSNSGEETYFSLRYRSTLRIVFTVFAERKGLSQENLKFSYNNQVLTGYETPYSLGLEDRARIDVQIGQRRA